MEVGGVALIVVCQDSSAAMTREMSEALQALAESETWLLIGKGSNP